MAKSCPKCNVEVNDDTNFCPNCGYALNSVSINQATIKTKTRENILKEKYSVEELNYQIASLKGISKLMLVFAIISAVLSSIFFILVFAGLIMFANDVEISALFLTITWPFFVLFLFISAILFILRATLISRKIHKRNLIINIINK